MQMTDGEEVEAGHGLVRDAEISKATRAEEEGRGEGEDREEAPPPADDGHGHGIKSGSTLRDATLAIIKSTIGPGILYMPKGFQEGGILFSLPMIILSYCLFCWGSTRILAAWHVERLSYAELMGRAFGPAGVSVVHFVIFCQQCGICLTYFIFVATNLRELCSSVFGIDHVSLTTLCLWQLAVYIPLVMIRDIQNFAKTNLIANVLILYSLVVLSAVAAIEVFSGPARDDDDDSGGGGGDDGGNMTGYRQLLQVTGREPLSKHLLFNPTSFYLFIGTSTYIFEGNMALVVPLQGAMREDLKTQFPRLFVRTLGAIVVLYISFGLLNWLAYGDDTNAVLTTNMPAGHLKESVQLAYVIAVIFTFPLQLFPSIQTARGVLPKLLGKVSSALGCDDWMPNMENNSDAVGGVDRSALLASGERSDTDDGEATMSQQRRRVPRAKRWRGISGRVLIAVALCLIAIAERNSLTKILSLLGAMLGIPLAYVFPSLIHLRMVPDSPIEVKRANFAVAALGVAFSVGCSVITLVTWNSDSTGGR